MSEKFDDTSVPSSASDSNLNTPDSAETPKANKGFMSTRAGKFSLGGASALAVTALALTLSVNLGAQPLIQLAAGGPGTESAPGKLMAGSEAEDAMWPGYWFQNEYVAGSELSQDTGKGVVYQLNMTGNPGDRLQQIADLFGIEGAMNEEEWSSKEYPSFSIGVQNHQVGISWNGTGSWYFSSWEESDLSGETTEVEADEFKPTPELLPSDAEVIAQALEIFNSTGLTVTASEIRTYRDEWSAGAFASLQVAGEDTALEWSIAYGSTGGLIYASGHSVEVVSRGEYNTVSPFDAVERIEDGRWWGSPASWVWEQYGSQASAWRSIYQEEVDPETGESLELEEPREVTIQTLTIEKSTSVMLLLYDTNGTAWLVPGLLLHNDQGWFDTVITLEDGVIELYEYIEPENLRVGVEPAQG